MSQTEQEAVAAAIAIREFIAEAPPTFAFDQNITGQWQYYAEDDERTCDTCNDYDSMIFQGFELQLYFPDLIFVAPDKIEPRVHIQLWGKDTCRCYLIRVA